MLISDIAIGVAVCAFLVTQIHLARVAQRLIKKSDVSWAQVKQTIFEAERTIHNDVEAQVKQLGESPGLSGSKTAIAELASRLDAFPTMIDDRFLKLQGGFKESFILFGDGLEKQLTLVRSLQPPLPGFKGQDPRTAQAAGVDSRKINQIISTLEAGAGTGGNLLGAVNDLAALLETFGEPNLADWLQENPDKLPMIYQRISRNPRLAQGLAKLEQKLGGGAPGNGGSQMIHNRGGEL